MTSVTESVLHIEDLDHIRILRLDRPEKLNAWTRQMHFELRDAMHRAGADPRLFLDTWLEVWGPPTGILVVTLALLGSAAVEIVARLLRARRARGPRPGSDPSP